jgi:Spy/CpxP family protein refolding chaperone
MTKAVVLVGFLVAFAAGLTVGIKWHRPAQPADTQPARLGGWFSRELSLTAQQQKQMDKIWRETAWGGGRAREDKRRRLFKERDEAVTGLIREEDKPRYEQIQKDFQEQMAALDAEWRGSYRKAVEETKKILTPEQQAKYEKLLEQRPWERGPHDRRRGDRDRETGRRPDRRPTSRPASQP